MIIGRVAQATILICAILCNPLCLAHIKRTLSCSVHFRWNVDTIPDGNKTCLTLHLPGEGLFTCDVINSHKQAQCRAAAETAAL